MPDINIPLIREKAFYPGQIGIAGSDNSLGLRTAGGNVYYVGLSTVFTTANDSNDGTDPEHPKATIQSALDACTAAKGDMVIVYPGHYDVTAVLTMEKSDVRLFSWDYLKGQGSPSTCIDGNADCHVIQVDADNVEIAGFRIASLAHAHVGIRVAVAADKVGCYIHDNLFAVGLYGIYLGVAAKWAQDVIIRRNTFMLMDNTAADAGIFLNKATRCIIEQNFFWSNVALAAYGVAVANASQPGTVIRDNDFQFQQAGTGIFRAGTTVDVSIHRNMFSGTITPITVLVDGGNHAVNNYVSDAAGGVLVDATT